MRKRLIILVCLLVAAGALGGVGAAVWHRSSAPAPTQASGPPPVPVVAAKVTGHRQIDEGNVIHPTDPNGLVVLTQIQPISLIFTLPETTFTEIQQEMAKGKVKVMAYSQDDKTKLDEGELLLIDNQIIQTTGTIRLRATFPNAQRSLWPGELVNVRLLLKTQPNGLTVAGGAVQHGPNGPYVYVMGDDQTGQMRPVALGQS